MRAQLGALAFEQGLRSSRASHAAWAGTRAMPVIGGAGKFHQRILGALLRRQPGIEQPFAQAIGGDHHILDVARFQQPLQHHRAIRQASARRLDTTLILRTMSRDRPASTLHSRSARPRGMVYCCRTWSG